MAVGGSNGGGCECGSHLRYGHDCQLVEVVDMPRLLPIVFRCIPSLSSLSLRRPSRQPLRPRQNHETTKKKLI